MELRKARRRSRGVSIAAVTQMEAAEVATLWIWQGRIRTTAALAGNTHRNLQAVMRDSLTLHKLAFCCD